jgi:hypothetical protein
LSARIGHDGIEKDPCVVCRQPTDGRNDLGTKRFGQRRATDGISHRIGQRTERGATEKSEKPPYVVGGAETPDRKGTRIRERSAVSSLCIVEITLERFEQVHTRSTVSDRRESIRRIEAYAWVRITQKFGERVDKVVRVNRSCRGDRVTTDHRASMVQCVKNGGRALSTCDRSQRIERCGEDVGRRPAQDRLCNESSCLGCPARCSGFDALNFSIS